MTTATLDQRNRENCQVVECKTSLVIAWLDTIKHAPSNKLTELFTHLIRR